MSLEPVTGFNIINNFLKLFRLEIPLTTPYINYFVKNLLVR